jgi:hypothetical protein
MNGRAIQFFVALILCVGVCRMLFPCPLDHASEGQISSSSEISLKDVEQEYPYRQLTISAAKANDNPGPTLPISLCEKEETDDEDETSDVHDQPVSLPGWHSGATFVDSLRQSRKVSPVPLFVLLHSWRHFLS